MKFSFTARTEPACKEFLSICKEGDSFETIDAFIRRYPNITTEEVNQCDVYYRGTTKPMKDWLNDYNRFISGMTIHDFEYHTMMDKSLIVAQYFVNKAIDCLQFARFFTIKSALILDTNYNINWNTGYPSQFNIRCIYFGTACTWYQNTMDHILQAVYWSHELYKNVTDRDNIVYNDTWNDKKIIENCTYEFVVGDLKAKNLTDIRKKITACSTDTETVRMWANYIKHKGGINYKYLEPTIPFEIFIKPAKNSNTSFIKIDDFKSPVEIDIDDELEKLKKTYIALYNCIDAVICDCDFRSHEIF